MEKHGKDPKKLWREVRQFWPSNKNVKTKIGIINGATDNQTKADNLNAHFATIGERLQKDIPNTDRTINMKPSKWRPPTFDIEETDIDTIIKAIEMLSSSRASAFDGITAYMLKSCKNSIDPTLLYLFTRSITNHHSQNLGK